MLVLMRRIGETVMVGNDVAITVLRIQGNQVRLGIAAPAEIRVHRKEIFDCSNADETADSDDSERSAEG